MTLGKRINRYRKELSMSQDDIAQKLLVSRQTISQWENDQTYPAIDNLVRLSEIFGVSTDDLLGIGKKNEAPLPVETYRFNFRSDELSAIHRKQILNIYKKPIIFLSVLLLLLLTYLTSYTIDPLCIIIITSIVITTLINLKSFLIHRKNLKKAAVRIAASVYEYNVFDDYIDIGIYRDDEKTSGYKCAFKDIEKISVMDKWLFLQFNGLMFILRKSDLKENSLLYYYMFNNPSKTVKTTSGSGFYVLSILLFVGSLLSILLALFFMASLPAVNGLSTENMWTFFAVTPIPIASVVVGFIAKARGLKYKKNIIGGFIMLGLLCLYGSFCFMF